MLAFYISEILKKQGKTADFNCRSMFFGSFLPLIEGLGEKNVDVSDERVSHVVSSWTMQKVEVPKDGNCLFRSIALGLAKRMKVDTIISQHLLHLGVPSTKLTDSEYLQHFLPLMMVEEWNTKQDLYQGFVTHDLF